MTRPWIEFVQSQRLAWRDAGLASRPGLQSKVLSRDPATGACSLLLRYPAGWRCGSGALAVDEELFVLDGRLEVDGRTYAAYGYAHLPAGYGTRDWHAPEETVALAFYAGTPAASAAVPYDAARLVTQLDALQVPYTGNFHPEFPAGAGRKILYQDPVTRDTTWLLGTLPLRWAERAEVHPTVEEMYLLAGEVHGNRGLMRPGAYFWRPGGVPHGPYGSQTGNLYFFRTKGGQLSTTYVEPERPFRWWPPYDPVLPPDYAACRDDAPTGARCW